MEGKFDTMNLIEKRINSSKVYDGRLLHVYKDEIELPNGHRTTREYIKHLGAVAIVAIDDHGRIAMERQFRYPFGKVLLEIPAGKLDYVGEDPLAAAKRELREETGIVAKEYEHLCDFYPTCAYSTENIHIFWAKELSYGERELDDDESINVEMMDFGKVVDMVLAGQIQDGKTQTAVLCVYARMNRLNK